MNATTLLVGLASGAASAALTFAVGAGSLFSVFLAIFAQLPILIAALGWRHHAGLIGSIAGSVFVYLLLDFDGALGYALSVALPAWWLGYLALLGQPADPDRPEQGMVWYPIGRLLAWAAVIGIVLVVGAVLVQSGGVEAYRATLRAAFTDIMKLHTESVPKDAAQPNEADIKNIVEFLVIMLPPMIAAFWTVVAMLNMWVAGRVVRASGRLVRPWPELAAFNLPALTLMALIGGIAGSFAPGLFGFAAGIVCAAFTVLFATLGLAFLHVATRGRPGRSLLLGISYALLCILPWAGALAALGVFEFLFGLRARMAAASLPPKPSL
ncbi:membrane protein [Terrihabitans soli]|uniref:Membrane protein n=1 Tax=Terrihabitans soli TaxID=708113 RepID=A0A6S6QPC5_9HYPH|nr:DUF2232 domain-containing protein [Terrihabitans soli]BCJ90839.1 membrane protein [Terrihabitans soli]